MYPLKENMALAMPLNKKMACLKPFSTEEIAKSLESGNESHYSFFVLPNGDVLDCRRPLPLTHLGVTDMIYENIDELAKNPELDYLKLSESAIFDKIEGPEQIRSTASAKDKLVRRLVTNVPALHSQKQQVGIFVSDDEVLTQDLGWTKIVVFKGRNYNEMVVKVPNSLINGRGLKSAQKASVVEIAEMFGLDADDVMSDMLERNRLLTHEFELMAGRSIR